MTTGGSDEKGEAEGRYLFERIGIYLLFLSILTAVTLVILLLPYEHTYIGDSGADRVYMRSFVVMAAAATCVFIIGIFYNFMVWMGGRLSDDERSMPRSAKLALSLRRFMRAVISRDFGRHLKVFVVDTLLIKKLWRMSRLRGLIHALILLSFLGILMLDIVTVLALDVLRAEAFIDPHGWGKLWIRDFGFELLGFLLLLGLVMAALRRFVQRPKQLKTGSEDVISIVFLLLVVLSGFVLEGLRIARELPGSGSPEIYSFLGALMAKLLPALSVEGYANAWMVHAVLSLALIAYIPFSKLFHLLAAPLALQVEEIMRSGEGVAEQ